MPTGLALNIGLNSVDPKHYAGWSGDLNACEADANDMASFKGFTATKLLTKAATRKRVTSEISKAAGKLKSGDIFLLSYSGHGGQLPDLNADELDVQDETWCLYDGELVDDELYSLLGKFAKGVRILVFSDSCHSGTVTKLAFYRGTLATRGNNGSAEPPKYRNMPPDAALRTYRQNKAFYDKILKNSAIKDVQATIKASVLLISGCQDNQLSSDGDFNGLFTANMLRVWNDGAFKGNYKAFHKKIGERMPPEQTPNLYRIGSPNLEFDAQKPFTV
jgi:hypothetical protein